jgi:hypothetical protein
MPACATPPLGCLNTQVCEKDTGRWPPTHHLDGFRRCDGPAAVAAPVWDFPPSVITRDTESSDFAG